MGLEIDSIMFGTAISSLISLLLVATIFFVQRKVPNIITRLFKVMMITSLLNLGFDIMSYLLGTYIPAGIILSTFVCLGYSVTAIMAWYLFMVYNYFMINSGGKRISLQYIYLSSVPSSLSGVMLLVWACSGNLVSYYGRSIGITRDVFGLIIINFIIYTVINIAMLLYFNKVSDSKAKIIDILCVAQGILLVVIAQCFGIMVESALLMINMIYLYIVIQRPKNHTDSEIKCFERRSFNEMIDSYEILERDYYIFTISLINSNHYSAKYGHEVKHELLKKIVNNLPKDSYITSKYRYDKDIFVVLTTDEKEFQKLIERWSNIINTTWYVNGNKIVVSFEIFYYFRNQKDGQKDILDFVSKVLSFEKNKRVACLSDMDTKQEAITRYDQVLSAVRKAIRNESFDIVLQPIYNVKTRKYDKVEVLARLFDNELGSISPAEFIVIAEENDIISDVTKIIVRKALTIKKKYEMELKGISNMSINLSSMELGDQELFIFIRNEVRNIGLNPESIVFEVTETAEINDYEGYCNNIKLFNEYGFRLSLDDYGTGYSSLERILNLPFEYIKIDRTLLEMAKENMKKRVLLEKTIEMFKACGYMVVIEGVEEEAQAEQLEAIGVDYIQGFYYSKPLAIEELIEWNEL